MVQASALREASCEVCSVGLAPARRQRGAERRRPRRAQSPTWESRWLPFPSFIHFMQWAVDGATPSTLAPGEGARGVCAGTVPGKT